RSVRRRGGGELAARSRRDLPRELAETFGRAPRERANMNGSADKITNVLLVDDDELDVESVRRAFAKGDIHSPLWVAGNGEEALRLLRGDEYPRERRLMLLDLNMPRMNGIELLREIRNDPSLHPLSVVVLTTSNEESDRVDAF